MGLGVLSVTSKMTPTSFASCYLHPCVISLNELGLVSETNGILKCVTSESLTQVSAASPCSCPVVRTSKHPCGEANQ